MSSNPHASIQKLFELRRSCSASVPPFAAVAPFIEQALGSLFPQLSPATGLSPETLATLVHRTRSTLHELLAPVVHAQDAAAVSDSFVEMLPAMHSAIFEDAKAILAGDPAAAGIDEVILAYPGFCAIAVYRIAHWLHDQKIPTVPRMLTEHAHRITGIDIHPGATIGRSFVIDHGTGIVIGETTEIADNVKIYQGVTLGALSVDKSMANAKRHPTIERNVVIYANATILGGETVVGEGSIIGGNVWLTTSVPPQSRVYHRGDMPSA
jgi:serine O-acetyltransferase